MGQNPNLTDFTSKIKVLQTRVDQREDSMRMNFATFQMQKWVSYTVPSEFL